MKTFKYKASALLSIAMFGNCLVACLFCKESNIMKNIFGLMTLIVMLVHPSVLADEHSEGCGVQNSQPVYLRMERPSSGISSTQVYMMDGEKKVLVYSGASGEGYSFSDGEFGDPPKGYDRYQDSKWAGTEYEGIFNDMILAVLPFEGTVTGWSCSNTSMGNCDYNDRNFKTYYSIEYNDYLDQVYRENFPPATECLLTYEDGWNEGIAKCQNDPASCGITASCPHVDTHALFSPSDGTLSIPAVDVPDSFGGITTYWAEMSLVPGEGLVFSVTNAEPIQTETPPSSSSDRYTDNGDGTVTDNRSGLVWLKNANCFNWQKWDAAMQSAANLASGQCDLSDGSTSGIWRLPSKEEWEAMIDENYEQPALSNKAGTDKWTEGDIFLDVQSNTYWSSTTDASDTTFAWYMGLGSHYVGNVPKVATCYVWPVRDGV